MFKNKKAQSGMIYMFLILVVFGLIYYTGLAPMVADTGRQSVLVNHLTGIDAFFFSNLNLFITIFYALALLLVGRMSL